MGSEMCIRDRKRNVRLRDANECTNKISSTVNKCVPPLQSAKVLTLRQLTMDMLIFSHKLAVPATTTETLHNCSSRAMLRRLCKNGSCLFLTISLRVFWAESVVCGWSFTLVFSLFDVLQVQVAPAQGAPKIELFSSLAELIAYPALFFVLPMRLLGQVY